MLREEDQFRKKEVGLQNNIRLYLYVKQFSRIILKKSIPKGGKLS